MITNILKTDYYKLSGGFIIPPFVWFDPNLDSELKFHLSEMLLSHEKNHGEIELTFNPFSDSGYEDFMGHWSDIIEELQDMFYIELVSKKKIKRTMQYHFRIKQWYLEYINKNPYYGNNNVSYVKFLADEILPTIQNKKILDKLSNYILEYPHDDIFGYNSS